jgi:VWFA-related protein
MLARRPSVAAGLLCGSLALASAQQEPPQRQAPRLGSGVTAIVVDVLVRDSKGNPVMDLGKQDFQVFEDGERQEIQDVTVIRGTPERPSGTTAAARVPSGIAPSFTAIVFNRLSPEARGRAYEGALTCLETMREGDFIGVFAAGKSLMPLFPYTSDRASVRKALDAAVRRNEWTSPKIDTLFPEFDPGSMPGPPPDVISGAPAVDPRTVQSVTITSWSKLDALQQGYDATHALLAVTNGLALVPGRKSIILFSEGMPVPDPVLQHFRNVISHANRSNVSVYTIDAAGLRTASEQLQTRDRVAWGSAAVGDALRTPTATLRMLAMETGGLYAENTNDLRKAFSRVDADRRSYYLLSYTPTNSNFNGRWRSISVKVPNRRVSVRARSGYLATRETSASALFTMLEYERPALAALDVSGRAVAPSDVPVRAAAFAFPGDDQPRVAVLAGTDASALRFDVDAKTGKYQTDFAIVARIVNARGEVVRKGSQPYRLSGPSAQVEQARRGEVLFYRNPTLEPGTYTLEVAVHDALASKSGVRRSTFTVPETKSDGLHVSSLVLVRRAERVKPEERDKENPLYIGDVLIYPNLGESISKSREKSLTFLVVVRLKPDATAAAPVSAVVSGFSRTEVRPAIIEIVRDGRVVAQAPTKLPAPDAAGRIEHIAQLPLAQLPPGRYTLRLIISEGDRREVRDAAFTIID